MNHDPAVASMSANESTTWWYKPLIWGGLLAIVYLLQEFFLIGFLTFLLCFIVRGAVGLIKRRIAPDRDSHALELALTVLVFVAICLVLYGIGRFFVPPVIRQARSLVVQVQNTSPEEVQNSLLSNTVGAWQFRRQFGAPGDPRYQEAMQQFQEAGRNSQGLYESFPKMKSRLQADFEADYERAQVIHLQSGPAAASSTGFEQWLMQIQVPRLFDDKSEYYIARWQSEFAEPGKADELATLKQQLDFESVRNDQIRQTILADIKSDPVQLAQFENQWAGLVSIRQWDEFRQSPEYQTRFQQFYETRRRENPAAAPIDFAFYQTLAAAYPGGQEAFLAAVDQHFESSQESLAHQRHDFETATRLELGQQWWAHSHLADWVRDHARQDGPKVLESIAGWFENGLGHLVRIPIQVATALVLAIFILIEWHGLKNGVDDLRQTRLRPVCDEVVPGIVALGKLIGKSFQGQVIIAMFNALFTLIALWWIGVEYKFVLTFIVFLFSFIPVVGVILSGIPLCAVALLQPGGSLTMFLEVILAIAAIHLIEGMILSPRIIGKIGHLHPVLVIVILLVSEHFFGIWGLILGVPVAIYLIRVVLLRSPIPGVYEPDAPAT